MGRYDLTDFERETVKPHLPNKPRGVPRVNAPRSPSGANFARPDPRRGRGHSEIFWVCRTAPGHVPCLRMMPPLTWIMAGFPAILHLCAIKAGG